MQIRSRSKTLNVRGRLRGLALATAALFAAPAAAWAGGSAALVWTATTGTGIPGTGDIMVAVGDTITADVVVDVDAVGIHRISLSVGFDPAVLQPLSAVECPDVGPGLCFPTPLLGNPIAPITSGPGSPNMGLQPDWDMDGRVGMTDYANLRPQLGLAVPPGDPFWDFNNDGVIAVDDSVVLGAAWGAPGSSGIETDRIVMLEAGLFSTGSSGVLGPSTFNLARIEFLVVGPASSSAVDLYYESGWDGVIDRANTFIADATNPGGFPLSGATVAGTPPVPMGPVVGFGSALLFGLAGLVPRIHTRRRGASASAD